MYKGKKVHCGWPQLPPELIRHVATHYIMNASTTYYVPRTWDSREAVRSRMIFVALLQVTELETLMDVCHQWKKACESHQFWEHATQLLDPGNSLAHHAYVKTNSNSSSAPIKISPYKHYTNVYQSSCIICRINSPITNHGLLACKRTIKTYNPPGNSIGLCRDHDKKRCGYCSLCFQDYLPSPIILAAQHPSFHKELIMRHSMQVALYESEDEDTFPTAFVTCRSCRTEALNSRIMAISDGDEREAIYASLGGRNFRNFIDDYETRSVLEAFLDLAEGSVACVVGVAQERRWLRQWTRLDEYLEQIIAARKLQIQGRLRDREIDRLRPTYGHGAEDMLQNMLHSAHRRRTPREAQIRHQQRNGIVHRAFNGTSIMLKDIDVTLSDLEEEGMSTSSHSIMDMAEVGSIAPSSPMTTSPPKPTTILPLQPSIGQPKSQLPQPISPNPSRPQPVALPPSNADGEPDAPRLISNPPPPPLHDLRMSAQIEMEEFEEEEYLTSSDEDDFQDYAEYDLIDSDLSMGRGAFAYNNEYGAGYNQYNHHLSQQPRDPVSILQSAESSENVRELALSDWARCRIQAGWWMNPVMEHTLDNVTIETVHPVPWSLTPPSSPHSPTTSAAEALASGKPDCTVLTEAPSRPAPTQALQNSTVFAWKRNLKDLLLPAMKNLVKKLRSELEVDKSVTSMPTFAKLSGGRLGYERRDGAWIVPALKSYSSAAESWTEPEKVLLPIDIVLNRISITEVVRCLREDESLWWDGFDWATRRKEWWGEKFRKLGQTKISPSVVSTERSGSADAEPDDHEDKLSTSSSSSGPSEKDAGSTGTSPVLSTSTFATTPSPPPIDRADHASCDKASTPPDSTDASNNSTPTLGVAAMISEDSTAPIKHRQPIIVEQTMDAPMFSMSTTSSYASTNLVHPIPRIPVDPTLFGKDTLDGLKSVWREACHSLFAQCRCPSCERMRAIQDAQSEVNLTARQIDEAYRQQMYRPQYQPQQIQLEPAAPIQTHITVQENEFVRIVNAFKEQNGNDDANSRRGTKRNAVDDGERTEDNSSLAEPLHNLEEIDKGRGNTPPKRRKLSHDDEDSDGAVELPPPSFKLPSLVRSRTPSLPNTPRHLPSTPKKIVGQKRSSEDEASESDSEGSPKKRPKRSALEPAFEDLASEPQAIRSRQSLSSTPVVKHALAVDSEDD